MATGKERKTYKIEERKNKYQMKMGENRGRVQAFWVLFSLSWFSSSALLSPTGVNFEGTQDRFIKEKKMLHKAHAHNHTSHHRD